MDKDLSELRAVRIDLERMVAEKESVPPDKEVLVRLGLTNSEADAWIQNEPDFNIPPRRSPPDNAIE